MGGYFSSQREHGPKSDTRHTTETGPFCVVCGGPFDIEGEVYNIDPKDPQFQWLYHLRLIGNVDDVYHHVVASDGHAPVNTSDQPEVFVSGPARFSLTGSGFYHVAGYEGQNDIWVDALSHIPGSGTLFPLHDCCLDISCRAIEYHQSKQEECDNKTALEVLIHLLNSRFTERQIQDGSLRSINDLFNLSSECSVYGPRSVLALTKLEWWGGGYDRFFTNPIEQVDTTAFVQRVLQSSPRTRGEPKFTEIPARKHQNLERLPKELLDEVCSYLPIPSTIALHRTSKILALQIPLDSTFWRNSLGDGSLHPHIWDLDTKRIEQQLPQPGIAPLDPTASWDWRCAAKILAMKRFPISGCDDRLVDVPAGFWNRCRIWATIEEALQQHIFE
ncbi:hypothetical protein COCMIDRAFT_32062 [Bipolaris oryzae ATCC 44560]|uniref:F-box domain-containing protein n=1 Tax=Bipolaris oryzae ATCC 44560 TaxID=930090 RepID=W6ZKD2_COCMI|nr:uncharacterized protein COCMIDRAFT_32062 [Bipolaris oryzae ATCC 44560]EUC50540.1 hypothetical protein COCMIDRAFT_32062 [Bipolaris oryzae ATCC 44560]